TVLIDCGEDDDGDFIVSFLKSKGISFIDRLYITHFDKDHTGGSDTVLANIKCGGVYLPFYQKTSTQYVEMMNAIFTAGLEPQYVKQNDTFSLGNIQYNVFPPMDFSYQNDEDNEFSLIISAKYGEKSFLFTGDALNGRINESIKDLGEYDFIKMPNHGDYFKGLVDLISKTKPKFAAITCSIQEPAAKKTLNLLKNASAEVFLTSNGSICASCDGKLINVTLID
ncbi:MAG: MBL fold metallo-hydrolase, partial [Clostridia bacterium]